MSKTRTPESVQDSYTSKTTRGTSISIISKLASSRGFRMHWDAVLRAIPQLLAPSPPVFDI